MASCTPIAVNLGAPFMSALAVYCLGGLTGSFGATGLLLFTIAFCLSRHARQARHRVHNNRALQVPFIELDRTRDAATAVVTGQVAYNASAAQPYGDVSIAIPDGKPTNT